MTNMQLLEIVIWALVAGFLVINLRRVLGKRTGSEKRQDPFAPKPPKGQKNNSNGNVINLPKAASNKSMWDDEDDAEPAQPMTPVQMVLAEIEAVDTSFDENEFIVGAQGAFEMILNAFAAGDEDALRPLLNDEVFANFQTAIEDRMAAEESMDTELIGFKSVKIVDAELQGSIANVTVEFVSDQVNEVTDKDGETVEGDSNLIVPVTDIWTFSRDIRSGNPNWTLIGTESPDEE